MTDNLTTRSDTMTDNFDAPAKLTSVLVLFPTVHDTGALWGWLDEGVGAPAEFKGGFDSFYTLVKDGQACDVAQYSPHLQHEAFLARLHANAPQMLHLLRQVVALTEAGVLVPATDDDYAAGMIHEVAELLAVASEVVEHVGVSPGDE
jgi:hypothetical protein